MSKTRLKLFILFDFSKCSTRSPTPSTWRTAWATSTRNWAGGTAIISLNAVFLPGSLANTSPSRRLMVESYKTRFMSQVRWIWCPQKCTTALIRLVSSFVCSGTSRGFLPSLVAFLDVNLTELKNATSDNLPRKLLWSSFFRLNETK